ncbi:MAG: hypothetical protein DRJ39_03715 [Thermoprotei archaeon]|nr:MAG: hypothetical protein DRJ39_03715 [Thermoprotei archaeon]
MVDQMVTREVIVSKLKEYFLERGFEFLLPEELKAEKLIAEFDLFFRDGNNVIAVKAYTPRDFLASQIRKELELIAVDILKCREYFDKVYVAVPESLGLIRIPREVFESAGIGIIKVGEERVEEKLPARALGIRKALAYEEYAQKINLIRSELSNLAEKMGENVLELKNEVKFLRQELEQLRKSLKILENEIRILKRKQTDDIKKPLQIAEKAEEISIEKMEGYPDFISDNPWVSLLAKRGREDEA